MFCCHQLHILIQLFWIKELRSTFVWCRVFSPSLRQIQFDQFWLRAAIVLTIGHPLRMATAKWQLILLLGEGKRKCSGLSAELWLGGWDAWGCKQGMGTGISVTLQEGTVGPRVSDCQPRSSTSTVLYIVCWLNLESLTVEGNGSEKWKVAVADFWNVFSVLIL